MEKVKESSLDNNYVKLNFTIYLTKTDKLTEYIGADRPTINILENRLQNTMEDKIETKFREDYPDFKGKMVMTEVLGNRIEGNFRSKTLVKRKHEKECLDMLKETLEEISGAPATVNVNMNCFL